MADNVIKAVFASGRRVKTAPLWRYDHGIRLQPVGLELPNNYEMHFSNSKTGEATTMLADSTGAVIPAEYLIPGTEVYAWIYLVGDSYGRTKAEIIIPVDPKAQPTDQEPTPEQQNVLEQAIEALNSVAGDIQGQIDDALEAAKESGEFDGEDGNSIWTTTERPMPASGGEVFTNLVGRSNVPPSVGDIIVRSSRYVYQVVEVLSSGAVVGYQIGDIKGTTGPQGAPGLGFPAGGKALHVLRKKTNTDYDTEWANPMDLLSDEVKQAILQFAEEAVYAHPTGQAVYTNLYNAFYPPVQVVSITAAFDQGTSVIYDDTALNDLKQYLTVTARYDDNTTAILSDNAYSLSGLLEAPSSTVTVLYNGVSTTFTVAVTARPALISITADYTQSGTVYDTDSLDSLKADLVVTAHYSDSSTQTVAADAYTLSGTLTVGLSTITVSYSGKTTTFDVTVTEYAVEIPTEGLLGYWDFRNLEAIPTAPVAADQGTARIVRFNASASDQYGLTKGTSAWAFNFSGGTTYDKFPVPFTIAGLSHNPQFAMSLWGNNCLVTEAPLPRFAILPYYKTTGDKTKYVIKDVPKKSDATYTSLIIAVDNDSIDYYVDGELVRTWNTADLEDFASWSYTTTTYANTGSGTNVTALGMWNRKLSAAEVMDVQEVFLSLEVTE